MYVCIWITHENTTLFFHHDGKKSGAIEKIGKVEKKLFLFLPDDDVVDDDDDDGDVSEGKEGNFFSSSSFAFPLTVRHYWCY